jgi:hypothetical protein
VLESGLVAITPRRAASSELMKRVSSNGADRMPPPDSGDPLTDEQIALLRDWIEQGASYATHWAFAPIDSQRPRLHRSNDISNPVDQYVVGRLERAGLGFAPEADRPTLIRRLYFDLLGLPPTADQVRRFAVDERPDAYSKLVDTLFASPDYGVRWGRHWLDVARYGDSNGGDENHAYPLAHQYRDYVIDAFNDDMPYDQFVTQQLAGDLLPDSTDDRHHARQLTATGYLAIGMKILAEQDPVKKLADTVDEQIDTFGRTFLGLSLGCARCHDHKFDPIPTRDYYALAGIFHSSKIGDQPVLTQQHKLAVHKHQARIDGVSEQLASIEESLVNACGSQGVVLREAESFDRGNVVIDNENYGKGIGIISDPGGQKNFAEFDIEVDESGKFALQIRYAAKAARPGQILINGEVVKDTAIARETGGWGAEFQAWTTEGVFTLREGKNVVRIQSEPLMSHIDKLRLIGGSQVSSQTLATYDELAGRLTDLQGERPKPRMVMAVVDGEPKNTHVHLRGSHLQLGEEVPRGFLSVLEASGDEGEIDGSGRLQLARWLTQNEATAALTARVIANRVWHWHFGRGLVATPDDFGLRGEPPTHPQLLDFLASELIRYDWSIKHLSRMIVSSRTYRMSSLSAKPIQSRKADSIDPDNRLFWKRDRKRIDAESLRDALLLQSGDLSRELGDSPMNVKSQDPSPMDMAANLETYESSRRRSAYLPVVRSNVYEFLTLFDFPNASTPVGKRDATTLPTQALWLMNSPFVASRAEKIVLRQWADSDETTIRNLYWSLFAREVRAEELAKGIQFVVRFSKSSDRTTAWTAFCQVLLSSNEYIYVK